MVCVSSSSGREVHVNNSCHRRSSRWVCSASCGCSSTTSTPRHAVPPWRPHAAVPLLLLLLPHPPLIQNPPKSPKQPTRAKAGLAASRAGRLVTAAAAFCTVCLLAWHFTAPAACGRGHEINIRDHGRAWKADSPPHAARVLTAHNHHLLGASCEHAKQRVSRCGRNCAATRSRAGGAAYQLHSWQQQNAVRSWRLPACCCCFCCAMEGVGVDLAVCLPC